MKKMTKKKMYVLTLVTVAVALSCSCGKKNSTEETADSSTPGMYSEEVADTGFEPEVDADGNQIIEVPERGLTYHISPDYVKKGLSVDPYNNNLDDYPISTITFMGEEADNIIGAACMLPEDERTPESDQKALEESWKHSGNLLTIVMIDDGKYKKLIAAGTTPDDISGYPDTKELKKSNGYTYLIARPEIDQSEFTDKEKQACKECSSYIDKVLSSLEFTKVTMEQTETVLSDAVPSFHTIDLTGKSVSESIFSKKDLTIVNIWGTFCGPCIEELPELGKWAKSLPENVQIIGLVGDVEGPDDNEHLKLANQICDKAEVSFTNLIPDNGLKKILKGVIGYPTTFLVDSNGTIIGDPIVGAYPDEYKAAVKKYLEH